MLAALALTACGGGGGHHATAQATGKKSPAYVRQCLRAAKLRVIGGPAPPGDTNAPATELIVGGGQSSAFLAFYENPKRAAKYAPDIRANAKHLNATVERYGKLTIVWVRGAGSDEAQTIRGCA
ncbi:MAG: hypothetical protein QOH13_566 [Thermoleophilaceae bacterium]|nr:hypothetical protein [Thermoleophilaceae bacterium]